MGIVTVKSTNRNKKMRLFLTNQTTRAAHTFRWCKVKFHLATFQKRFIFHMYVLRLLQVHQKKKKKMPVKNNFCRIHGWCVYKRSLQNNIIVIIDLQLFHESTDSRRSFTGKTCMCAIC